MEYKVEHKRWTDNRIYLWCVWSCCMEAVLLKHSPAVVWVHTQSFPRITDVLLQRRASTATTRRHRPTTTLLEVWRTAIRRTLAQIHLVKLQDTCETESRAHADLHRDDINGD